MGYAKLVTNANSSGSIINLLRTYVNIFTGACTSINSAYFDPVESYIIPSNSEIGNWSTYKDDWVSNTSITANSSADRLIAQLYSPCANTSRPDKVAFLRVGTHVPTSTYTANQFANSTGLEASAQNQGVNNLSGWNGGFILNTGSGRARTSNNGSYSMFGYTGNTVFSDQSASNQIYTSYGRPNNIKYTIDGKPFYETYRPLYGSNTTLSANGFKRCCFSSYGDTYTKTQYLSWSKHHIFILEQVPGQTTSTIHAVFEHNDFQGAIDANVVPVVATHIPHTNSVSYSDHGSAIRLTSNTSGVLLAGPGFPKTTSLNSAYTIQILGGRILNTYTAQTVLQISEGGHSGCLANSSTEDYPFLTYGDYSNTIQSNVRRDLGNGTGFTNFNFTAVSSNYRMNLIGASLANNSVDFNFIAFPFWFTAPKIGANYVSFSDLSKVYATAYNAMANDTIVTIDSKQYRYINNSNLGNHITSGFLLPNF